MSRRSHQGLGSKANGIGKPAAVALLFLFGCVAHAQDAPLISGGIGFLSTTTAGETFVQPVIAPVADVPLGAKFLFEARGDLRGFIAPQNGNGPYEAQFFGTLDYAQIDYLANSHMTISAGRFLTPFNVYDERLTAIWVRNFADAPIIFPIGTRTAGSSNGVMVRGMAAGNDEVQLTYATFFSAASTVNQALSGRAAGMRAGIFLPKQQLEIGGSYQRYLQDTHFNAAGAYAWWVPTDVPVQFRSEYAHSPQGHGYWMEGAFRFSKKNQITTWTTRIQPLVRVQQFFRGSLPGGSLPSADTTAADVGVNVYLPQDVRISSSYSRQTSAGTGFNVWDIGLTYRFILPLVGGKG